MGNGHAAAGFSAGLALEVTAVDGSAADAAIGAAGLATGLAVFPAFFFFLADFFLPAAFFFPAAFFTFFFFGDLFFFFFLPPFFAFFFAICNLLGC